MYPYNTGDLTISAMVLYNYLEANAKVPWEDLRYLFGEIMYGGHITDDWDRKLCRTYLEEYMHAEMVSEGLLEGNSRIGSSLTRAYAAISLFLIVFSGSKASVEYSRK